MSQSPLLAYAGEWFEWHPDWPEERPSDWDRYPRIAEDPLDVPPWYSHEGRCLFYSWRSYGFCRGCRLRVEAPTEDEARLMLIEHGCKGFDPQEAFTPRKKRLTKGTAEKKPRKARLLKHDWYIDICGGCYERFADVTRAAAAEKLQRHVELNPCPHYADESGREAWNHHDPFG